MGAFAKLRQAAARISFVASACPAVHMGQLSSHWTDFHDILYFGVLRKSVEKTQVPLQIGPEFGYFT